LVAVKLAGDPIFCGRDTSHVTRLWWSRDSLNLGAALAFTFGAALRLLVISVFTLVMLAS
jgi:hypothetical protein